MAMRWYREERNRMDRQMRRKKMGDEMKDNASTLAITVASAAVMATLI